MIAINCTHCRQRLEMDEAFAGGVCRCQYCGTIQTVPSRKSSSSSSSGTKSGKSTKTLYKKKVGGNGTGGAPAGEGTGLDELAEIVASSGLARGSLSKPAPPRQADSGVGAAVAAAPAKRNPMLPWLIGAGALVVVLLIVVIVLVTRPSAPAAPTAPTAKSQSPVVNNAQSPSPAPSPNAPQDEQPAPPVPAVSGPAFADVPLPTGVVVYVIDRSQANDEILDTVKDAVYKSVLSLGEFRRFQIIFWEQDGEGMIAHPEGGPEFATPAEVEAAKKRFDGVASHGRTNLKPTLERAVKAGPSAIVLITAKGFQLDDTHAAAVAETTKGVPVKVHTIGLGEEESAILQQIAASTGGTYRRLSYNQLRKFTE